MPGQYLNYLVQKTNTKALLVQMPYNLLLAAVIASIFGYVVSYNRTVFLEKELVRVDKEIQQKETVFQRRQAVLSQDLEQDRLKVEQLLNEH